MIKHQVKRPDLQNRHSIPLRTSQMTLPQCHNVYFFSIQMKVDILVLPVWKNVYVVIFPKDNLKVLMLGVACLSDNVCERKALLLLTNENEGALI